MTLRMTKQEVRTLQHSLLGEPEDVTPKKRNKHDEDDSQVDLFKRIRLARGREPRLTWCFATFNGIPVPMRLAVRMKAMGNERGVFDIWLVVRMGACPGLVIDMKTKSGRPTPEQKAWRVHMESEGWRMRFCVGWEEAWREICEYLGIDPQLG